MKVYYDSSDAMPCPAPTGHALRAAIAAYQESSRRLSELDDGDLDALYLAARDWSLIKQRLTTMVLVVNGCDPFERVSRPVSIDLGDTLVIVTEHPNDMGNPQGFNAPLLVIVPKATVVTVF
jgi:hypothetical protein